MFEKNNLRTTVSLVALLTGLAPSAYAQSSETMETVTITGYRASLADSTNAKKAAIGFSEAVFAEDIGKFPDTNVAEALNRVPGITINREATGEGLTVAIRGLGTNFTRILLNSNPVDVASNGPLDGNNGNRQVDLNLFPTELFTQLTVAKSPTADTMEGGASGTINMRSARPFDNPGMHFTYILQGTDNSHSRDIGESGAFIASNTWDKFGVLVGITAVHSNFLTRGWESGNAGYVTPGALTTAQCGAGNTCDTIGGDNFVIPSAVPTNVSLPSSGSAVALVPGKTIDAAYLTALNPGLTTAQISNALIPRLPREMIDMGYRDRFNGVMSMEFRPTDNLNFYLDTIIGRKNENFNRSDWNYGIRAGNVAQPVIPQNMQVDSNGVVTSATFANLQVGGEFRPYYQNTDFFSINPGMHWNVTDSFEVDANVYVSRSHFWSEVPTIFLATAPATQSSSALGVTPPVGGMTASYKFTGDMAYPVMTPNIDLGNPSNWQWATGRVNLDMFKRYTRTDGAHLDLKYGGDELNVKLGVAFDDAYRSSRGYSPTGTWQAAICGGNPSSYLPSPNSQPSCQGSSSTAASSYLSAGLPGYGTGFSSGFAPLTFGGSLIPQSAISSYLYRLPNGYVSADFNRIKHDSNYAQIRDAAIASVDGQWAAGGRLDYPSTGGYGYDETNVGLYGQVSGVLHMSHDLHYNLGLRWVETHQSMKIATMFSDTRNATLADGGKYPNYYTLSPLNHTYSAFLPSVSVVYDASEDLKVRASVSRTMTRPDVGAMVGGVSFVLANADQAGIGNPSLKPYFSNNIDIGAELYTGGEGYIGFAAFRKGISGFTISQNTVVPFSDLAPYGITYDTINYQQQTALAARNSACPTCASVTITKGINAPGILTINGLEFDVVQPLDFLTEVYGVKGFGVTGNVTILDQRSSGAAPTHATGVAPYTYNLTGYYDNDGYMVRLSYVFTDASYNSGSNVLNVCLPNVTARASDCPAGAYIFNSAYGQADFSSSVKLANLFGELPSDPELTFNVQNLFHSKLRKYFQYERATERYYDPGSMFTLGIRGRF